MTWPETCEGAEAGRETCLRHLAEIVALLFDAIGVVRIIYQGEFGRFWHQTRQMMIFV